MSQLKVVDVRWVAALCNWDDVINYRTHWIWRFQRKVNRLSTYAARVLRSKDNLLILFVSGSVMPFSLRPVDHGASFPFLPGGTHEWGPFENYRGVL